MLLSLRGTPYKGLSNFDYTTHISNKDNSDLPETITLEYSF